MFEDPVTDSIMNENRTNNNNKNPKTAGSWNDMGSIWLSF